MSDPQQEGKPSFISVRLNFVFVLVFIFFAALIFRLAAVQLVEGKKYLRDSVINSMKVLPVTAPRGMIYDRNGQLLVWNKPIFTVAYLEPEEKVDEKSLSETLSKIIGMDSEEILKAMNVPQPSYIPKRIKEGISEKEMFMIEERRTLLPGIEVMMESVRQIKGSEASPTGTHIFGYVNSIPSSSVKDYIARGYRPSDRIGVLGLEKMYERQLRGVDGEYEIRVNKNAETMERQLSQPPVPGHDLVLTVDWEFQQKVERILKEEITRIQKDNRNVKEAIAVAMNPQTGEMLALANYPNYDLNYHYTGNFGKIYNDKIKGREANRAINSAYPIGSTIKPLSEMLGMERGLVAPEEKIFCGGSLKVGDRYVYCWKETGHGWVDAREAIKVSCNVYQYELALRLAEYPQKKKAYLEKFPILDSYFSQFGLGQKTGLDLPGESMGWRTNTFFLGNLAYALIGQYNAYTPMQLLQYISTIANDGYRMKPFFVKEIRTSTLRKENGGMTVMRREPEVLNRVDIPQKMIQTVKEGMSRVVQPGGTAYLAYKDFPIPIAAKTGTAQTGSANDNSLIAGYAPFENPEIAFAVIVPKGGHGSDASGPISRKILDAYFHLDEQPAEQKNDVH